MKVKVDCRCNVLKTLIIVIKSSFHQVIVSHSSARSVHFVNWKKNGFLGPMTFLDALASLDSKLSVSQ